MNNKAIFYTKIVGDNEDYTRYNNQLVEVLEYLKGKDVYCDRYIVRFSDGTIANNIMSNELDFIESESDK